MAKSGIRVLDGSVIQWITTYNYVRLWDERICLLNFASRFIYSVLQMLACYLVSNNYHNILMKLI